MFRRLFLVFFIFINITIAAFLLLQGDIFYYSDSARDFLLMREIIASNPIMLIGQRSGLGGVFHGPAWLYLNLPAFIIGQGSPVVMGWFWLFLYLFLILEVWFFTKKLFSSNIAGLLAAALTSALYAYHVPFMYNPHGAVILAPPLFYFFSSYLKQKKFLFLFISFLILGFVIQFEMAFGVPLLIITILISLFVLIKSKKYSHIFAFAGLLPGLSTFILFDATHNFIQLNSVLSYLNKGSGGSLLMLNPDFWKTRFDLMLREGLNDFTKGNSLLSLFFLGISFWATIRKRFVPAILFLIWFFGFWIITLPYRDMMWPFYHWPLHLMAVMLICGIAVVYRRWFLWLLLSIFFINAVLFQIKYVQGIRNFSGTALTSWKFNKAMIEKTLTNTPKEFGYFVYSHDFTAYQMRYAFEYISRKKAQYNSKKPYTLLVIIPTTNQGMNPDWWQKNVVHINRKPDRIDRFPYGIQMLHFKLNKQELQTPADPSLVDSMIFR